MNLYISLLSSLLRTGAFYLEDRHLWLLYYVPYILTSFFLVTAVDAMLEHGDPHKCHCLLELTEHTQAIREDPSMMHLTVSIFSHICVVKFRLQPILLIVFIATERKLQDINRRRLSVFCKNEFLFVSNKLCFANYAFTVLRIAELQFGLFAKGFKIGRNFGANMCYAKVEAKRIVSPKASMI